MNYKTLILTACFVLASAGSAQAETQVLNLQTASVQSTACGDFALESVDLNATSASGSSAGSLSITNEAGQAVAARKFEAGQAGTLSVKVQALGEDKVEALALQIVQRGEDGELQVLETAEANAAGEAVFSSALPAGEYQVALSCGTAVAGGVLGSTTAGVAALGAAGVTALTVGATSGSGSNSRVEANTAGNNPRVDEPQGLSLPSASASN